MTEIIVTKPQAFHMANAFRADHDYQAVFRFIRFSPSGRITGTDGFRASDHKNAAEPFDAEKDVFVRPLANIPVKATNIRLELDDNEGLIHFINGRKEGVVKCNVTADHTYPDVDRVIPTVAKPVDSSVFGINAKFLMDAAKVLNNNQLFWQTSGTNTPALIVTDDPEHVVMLVPLRFDPDKYTLPMRQA